VAGGWEGEDPVNEVKRLWIGGLAVVIFLALWEAAMPLGWVKVADISRPSLVAKAFVELVRTDDLFYHLGVSHQEFFIGFVLSLVVGVPLGVALGRYRTPGLLLDPLLMAVYTTPRVAMMPLLVVAFGVGFGATIAVVFLGAVFPIMVNTAVGVREIDPVLIRAVRSFGGNEWNIFTKVLLPGAVPPIITGIRLGVGRGILGMVVGEMYAATEGIGQRISLYGSSFLVPELMALIIVVSLLGFLFVSLIRLVEERFRYRRMETEI
jgi:ABC-type nitrate/sulfonate/bicarbonate transport system permease component